MRLFGVNGSLSFFFLSLFLQFLLFFFVLRRNCVCFFLLALGFVVLAIAIQRGREIKTSISFYLCHITMIINVERNSTNVVILLERILECFSGTSTIVLIICDILSKQYCLSYSLTHSCLQMLLCWPINCGIIHIYFHTFSILPKFRLQKKWFFIFLLKNINPL